MPPSLRAARWAAVLIACAVSVPAAARAQVQVTLRPLGAPEVFYVADFLPGNSGLRPDLIGITLINGDPGGTGQAVRGAVAASQTISLEINVSRESPRPVQIFQGTTNPFVFDQPVRHLTARDLATRGRDVSITDFTVNDDALDGPGGRTGRLPAGTYLFRVIVRDTRGSVIDQDELRLNFTASTRVELLSPGGPADVSPPTVPGPTPRFLWSANGDVPGARYRVRVVRVDDAGSAVEALQSGFPSWDAVLTGTSAFYPASSEALRLEPGSTYAWQVTRDVGTSAGAEPVESPIYWFRVGGPGVPGAAGGTLAPRFAALLRALGITGLDGFTPVGATLEDGRPIALDKLEALLAAIADGQVTVLDVKVR